MKNLNTSNKLVMAYVGLILSDQATVDDVTDKIKPDVIAILAFLQEADSKKEETINNED